MFSSLIEKAYAADVSKLPGINVNEDSEYTKLTLQQLILKFINIFLWVAGVLAVIYLIYSGILYITAAGNPDAAKKGQQGIVNAVIGIVVIALTFVIIGTLNNFGTNVGVGSN